jgi:hypothetical protein
MRHDVLPLDGQQTAYAMEKLKDFQWPIILIGGRHARLALPGCSISSFDEAQHPMAAKAVLK